MSDDKKDDELTILITGHGIKIERNLPMAKLPSLMAILMGQRPDPEAHSLAARGMPQSLGSGARLSVVEYMQQKMPRSMPQIIVTLGRYAEVYDSSNGFSRADIRRYLRAARVPEPGNFSRDFQQAVALGYIHETGDDSFQVTQTGVRILGQEGSADFSRPPGVPARRRSRPSRGDISGRETGNEDGDGQ